MPSVATSATRSTCPPPPCRCTSSPTVSATSARSATKPSPGPGCSRVTWGLTLERNLTGVLIVARSLLTDLTWELTCRPTMETRRSTATNVGNPFQSKVTWSNILKLATNPVTNHQHYYYLSLCKVWIFCLLRIFRRVSLDSQCIHLYQRKSVILSHPVHTFEYLYLM